ncbi:YcnI family protein [Micromonospora sp. 15K316]|uniref:YcnI family protein n=1 Tax=Micromonospora sp. 15K316 TaxID=2530376 RepID=UPI00140431EB|nr:YcnI family protein [Micromonospora sp. 15K316]
MAMTRADRRRAATTAALVTGAVLSWPTAAYAADVTTTPTQARQGDAVRLEFVVPEERPGSHTEKIEIQLPAETPIAEVYPMSVTGWAPRLASRTLDEPVSGMHSTGVSTVTTSVTWIRVEGATPGPARLSLSMGPLPRTDRLTFPVVQTYADGTVVRWTGPSGAHPAPRLTLLPAAPGVAGGAAGHAAHGGASADTGAARGGTGANGSSGAGGAGFGGVEGAAGAAGGGTGGNADALLAAGLLAGLGGGAAIGWLASRWRRRSSDGGRAAGPALTLAQSGPVTSD